MKTNIDFCRTETTFKKLNNGEWFIFCGDSEATPCLKFTTSRYFDTANNECVEKVMIDENQSVIPLHYYPVILNRVIEFYQLNCGDLFLYHRYDDFGEEVCCNICVKLNKNYFYDFVKNEIQKIEDNDHEVIEAINDREDIIIKFFIKHE